MTKQRELTESLFLLIPTYQVSLEKDSLPCLILARVNSLISENLYMDSSKCTIVTWRPRLSYLSTCKYL